MKQFERKWVQLKKVNYSASSQSASMYWTSQIDKLLMKMSNTESDLMDFSYKTSQVGDIWLFCCWRCTDTHTPGDFETCITYKSSAQAYSFSPDRNLEPGSKGTDIGMQLTLATVWVVNILSSVSVSLSPSFFSPSLRDPWLSDWLTAIRSLVMNSNMKLQRVTSRYACHNR